MNNFYFKVLLFRLVDLGLNLVFPPFDNVMSTGSLFLYEPHVKSGTSIEFDRFATDHSLKGAIELQSAAS